MEKCCTSRIGKLYGAGCSSCPYECCPMCVGVSTHSGAGERISIQRLVASVLIPASYSPAGQASLVANGVHGAAPCPAYCAHFGTRAAVRGHDCEVIVPATMAVLGRVGSQACRVGGYAFVLYPCHAVSVSCRVRVVSCRECIFF